MRTFDGEPEKPTEDDFETWRRVGDWWKFQEHRLAAMRGRYELEFAFGDPPMICTEHAREVFTLELAEDLGMTVVVDADGNAVGWQGCW
jgi:hypothetical protein